MVFGDYKVEDVIEKFQFFKFTSLIKKVMDMSGESAIAEESASKIDVNYDVDSKEIISIINEKENLH